MDLVSSILLFIAVFCGVVGFVVARRIFVTQRNRTYQMSEIYGMGKRNLGKAKRMQTKTGTWIEAKMMCAGIDASPVIFLIGVAMIGMVIGLFLQGAMPGVGFVIGIAIAAVAAVAYLNKAAEKRSHDFDQQLATALPMISENLRGGSGLESSISAVASFMPEPIHSELSRVIDEVSTASLTLPESLERLGVRIDSKEAHFLAISFQIQREGGGNLASMIDTVAETVARRLELRDQIKTSTANARFSAVFVAAMPFAVFGLFAGMMPSYMVDFWAFPFWPVIIAIAAALDLGGLLLIRRMYVMKLD